MKLHEIKAPKGANKRRKRVGRGPGSGLGKTAGRGHKGQKSRVGNMNNSGFEGGQMPLQRRLPKIGFRHAGAEFNVFNVDELEAKFEDGDVVDEESLRAKRMLRRIQDGIKILGRGELKKKLTVRAHKVTAGGKAKIEQAGGTVEILPPPKRTAAAKSEEATS